MPEISRFFGIVIKMFYNEHGVPHFHAYYEGNRLTVFLSDGTTEGDFPRRARQLVLEWYSDHRQELLDNWERARIEQPLKAISPLE